MMVLYTPLGLDNFELCHPVDEGDFETINLLINGEPRQATWEPLPVRLIRKDQGRKLLPSDTPWLGEHALIFKQSAIDILGAMLREYGELLPLECSEAEVFIFNPTRVIDVLDEQRSSLLRFSSGRIMDISRYIFHADAIRNISIFKIPNLRVSPTFVSQPFVDLWRSAGLKGLEFTQVWADA